MLRLEAEAQSEAAGEKTIGAARAAELRLRRVEDIIGKGSVFGGKDAGYAANGTLAF